MTDTTLKATSTRPRFYIQRGKENIAVFKADDRYVMDEWMAAINMAVEKEHLLK